MSVAEAVPEEASPALARGADAARARRVATNSLWLAGQPLALNAISILSTAYIARKLGAADYGSFNVGFAQVALFAPLCNLGLRAVAVRAIAEDRERAQEVAQAVFALRILLTLGAVLLALAWLALPTYSPTTRLIGLAAVLSMVCTSLGFVAVDLCQGFERPRLSARVQIVGGLVLTLLSVAALLGGLGLAGFVAAYVVGAAIQTGLLFVTVARNFFRLRPAWKWERMRGLARQARPFAVNSLLSSVTDGPILDVLILGAFFAPSVVGPYAAAIGLVARLLIIPHGIGDALYPAVANAHRADRSGVGRLVGRSIRNLLLLAVPAALALTLLAPIPLRILFGEPYAAASDALRIAAWLLPLTGLSYVIRESLSAVHRQGTVVRMNLAGAGLLVALYAVLIPAFGPVGAASAGVIRELLMLPFWITVLRGEFGGKSFVLKSP